MLRLEPYDEYEGYDGSRRSTIMDAYYKLFEDLDRPHLLGLCLDFEFDYFAKSASEYESMYGIREIEGTWRLYPYLLEEGITSHGGRLRTFGLVLDDGEPCWYQIMLKLLLIGTT